MMAEELARRACAVLLDRDAATVVLLADSAAGRSAVVRVHLADDSSVVVKVYRGRRQPRGLLHADALAAVRLHTTISTAEALACGAVPGTDVTALITTDLGSTSLHAAVHNGVFSRGQALTAMGRLLAQLHRIPTGLHPGGRRGPRIDATALLARSGRAVFDARLVAVLSRAAAEAQQAAGRVWCHGDLHPANVLVIPPYGRLAVVDMEDVTHAAPEYDLAQCLVTSDALDPDDRAAVLAGYGRPFSVAVLDDLVVYQAVRGLVHAADSEHRDQHLWKQRFAHAARYCLHP